jgi:hypothetical protein
MVVKNKGAVPLRLVADARLLSLEIEPDAPSDSPASTAKPKPVRCALPADMRPSTDDERLLVLPPGRSYGEAFDPRLFCFGAKESAALAQGGKITARLGWTNTTRLERPFVVSPFEGIEPRTAAAKSIVAAPFAIPPAGKSNAGAPTPMASASTAGPAPSSTPSLQPQLIVSMAEFVEAERGAELAATVNVKNAGDRAAHLRLRADTIAFTVTNPAGTTSRCGRTISLGTPMREMFDTVPARGSVSVSVLLSAVCPATTFAEPGLYRLVPAIDTRHASGERIGLATFDGEVSGTKTTFLRIHAPLHATQRPRPVLE